MKAKSKSKPEHKHKVEEIKPKILFYHEVHKFIRLSEETGEVTLGNMRHKRRVFRYKCDCGETEIFYRLLHDYQDVPDSYRSHAIKGENLKQKPHKPSLILKKPKVLKKK